MQHMTSMHAPPCFTFHGLFEAPHHGARARAAMWNTSMGPGLKALHMHGYMSLHVFLH